MKNLLLIFSVLLSTSLSAVEYGGLSTNGINGYPSYVTLEQGDVLEVLSCSSNRLEYNQFVLFTKDSDLDTGGNAYQIDGYLKGIATSQIIGQFDTFVGPLKLKIYRNPSVGNSNGSDFLAFYRITRASEYLNSNPSSFTNIIPSSAVVIPSDSSGPVQIILESSEDMVNWNSANPGTYGASTNERFFRVRAVENTE